MNDREASRINDAMAWDIDWSSPIFVGKFRGGDPTVLGAIYRQHLSDVSHVVRNGFGPSGQGHAFIPGIRLQDERDDLLQEVFARAFSSRARLSFDPSRAYGPYLLAIGRHVLADWHRTNRKRRRLDGSLREATLLSESHRRVVGDDPEPTEMVEAYVDTLDRRLKEIYEQMIVCGRSQRDTALALGLSRQNVRTLEQRLRAGLKRAVDF